MRSGRDMQIKVMRDMTISAGSTGRLRARLRDLLHDCVASAAAEQADRLAEACELLACGHDAARIDVMLRAGAYESAALAVIGEGAGYMLSRGPSGSALASVILPGSEDEATAEASTPALALIAAHVAAILDDAETSAPRQQLAAPASVRLH